MRIINALRFFREFPQGFVSNVLCGDRAARQAYLADAWTFAPNTKGKN